MTLQKTLDSGTYYWRVRALSPAPVTKSAWSATCSFTLAWTDAPTPSAPSNGATIDYPTPLLFQWSAVNGAKSYKIAISAASDLSNQLPNYPMDTNATSYAPRTRLAPGTYYWSVTPVDPEGHLGTPSATQSFTWDWPSTDTTLHVSDLDPSAEVYDPQFSWDAIPGAQTYELEINSDASFSPASKVCCSDTIVSTAFSPTQILPADTYYWRIRAKDPNGNYGGWVVSPDTFTNDYDTNGVSGLTMSDPTGTPVAPGVSTDTPIVTWDPTPGASSYLVDVVQRSGATCNWSQGGGAWHIETAATAWTPLGSGFNAVNPWGSHNISTDSTALAPGSTYCVRVTPRRSADDSKGGRVVGGTTYLAGSLNGAAFTFTGFPTGAACTAPCDSSSNIGAADYLLPAATGNTRLPLFTWNAIAGVRSYFVVVATDGTFQHVIDEAFTQVPAYSPRNSGSPVNYADTNTQYSWAVLPSPNLDGSGTSSDPRSPYSYPQTFDFHSVAPSPVAPAGNATITTQPTFQWTPVEGAAKYKLLVSSDSSFGTLVGDTPVTTTSTSFTGTNFPASAHLWWKVQAIDRSDQGLAWTTPMQFQKTLAAPTFTQNGTLYTNPTTADGIPALHWDSMDGAISYNLTITASGYSATFTNLQTTAFTPQNLGTAGNISWNVSAQYPTAGGTVTSGTSPDQSFVRSIAPPAGMASAVSGQHTVAMSWSPKPGVKNYVIELSTNDAFPQFSSFDTQNPENTVYAPDLKNGTYTEGGPIYWHVAAVDPDGTRGSWSATQTLTLPQMIHPSANQSYLTHGVKASLKVYAKTGAGVGIPGVTVTISGAGLTATSKTTGSTGYALFSVKPPKTGTISITLKKSGCITASMKVTVG